MLHANFNKVDITHVFFMRLDKQGYDLPVLAGIDFKVVKIDVFVSKISAPKSSSSCHLKDM